MKKIATQLNETMQEKKDRIRIQECAENVKIKWAKKGLSDIFEILENECILIRNPLNTKEISGFSTYFSENFIVFLNSSFTLGHERFSGAHELAHLILHRDQLLRENLIDANEINEKEATIFAVEFLMPETGIKEIFYKIVGLNSNEVDYRHVIRMHHYFKVSYKAMLKRLVYLGLCDENLYERLADFCTLDNKDKLQELTKKEGYECDLIDVSNIRYVSKEYEEIIRSNYEKGKISFGKLESLLEIIGKKPVDFDYEVPDDDC